MTYDAISALAIVLGVVVVGVLFISYVIAVGLGVTFDKTELGNTIIWYNDWDENQQKVVRKFIVLHIRPKRKNH